MWHSGLPPSGVLWRRLWPKADCVTKEGEMKIRSDIRVNAYRVLERAVEIGVLHGWSRAHKHSERPGEIALRDTIAEEVMNEICEWISFSDLENG